MRIFLLTYVFLSAIEMHGQLNFRQKNDIPVKVGGQGLQHPWAGGVNYPVFSEVDFDLDGLKDLFIYDRSSNRAMVFIHTGGSGMNSFRYAEEYAEQLPALRGWALFYDYNCDGKPDLFTTGITNNGILQFRNDSQPGNLLFTAVDSMMKADYGGGTPSGIFASGFLMPHFNDIDGDGDMDVLGQQFFCVGTFAYYKNMSMENYGVCDSLSKYVLQTYAWGNFALRSGAYENVAVGQFHITCMMATPPEGMFGYELAQQDDTYAGIYTIDIDDDGDMEALIGDSGAKNSLLVINGGTSAVADMVSQDTLFPSYDVPSSVNYFATYAYQDVDHDGVKDLLVGHNEFENKKGILLYRNTGTDQLPVFDFVMNDFLVNQMIDVGEGAVPVFFDANADGLKDLVIGNISRTDSGTVISRGLTLFQNIGTLNQPSFEFISDDYAGLSAYPVSGPVYPAFGDLDSDGDMDLLLGLESGELYRFENTAGAGMPASFSFISAGFYGIDVGNFACPQIIDLNRDGKNDLVIGAKNGMISYFENTGTAVSPFFLSQATIDSLGGINVQTPLYVDGYSVPFVFEESGEYKMMVACMRGDVYLFGNIDGNLQGVFSPEDTLITRYQGLRTGFNLSVSGGDINGDNRTDMALGLFGGGVQIYLQDTSTSSISGVSDNPIFNIYPNPSKGYFDIHLKNPDQSKKYRLLLTDSYGRIIREEETGSEVHRILTDNYTNGLYFVTISDQRAQFTRRIVVIK
jgi:hypothetical protein